jgi:hypothetical protein
MALCFDNSNYDGPLFWSSQVKLLITNNAFLQKATAHAHLTCNSTVKNMIFRDYGLAKAPPGFQAVLVF